MIEWFFWLQLGVAALCGVFCLVMGVLGRLPNDFTIGAALLVEALLIAQLVVAIVAPAFGNNPSGSSLEFYTYLVSALVIPPATAFWSLIERNRWSTVILGVACLAVAVMLYRMNQIWVYQVA
jgi:hypothetical protein